MFHLGKFPFLFKEERRKRNAINGIGSMHLNFLSDSKLASTLVFLHNTSNYVHSVSCQKSATLRTFPQYI